MVIIDTSAWIEFFRHDGKREIKLAVKGLLDAFEGALCGPVEMEFLGGANPHEMKNIQQWFDIMPYAQQNQRIWRKAAENFQNIRESGHTTSWNIVLVASIAKENNFALYAHDEDVPNIAKTIGVHLYTPGYNGMYNPDY